MSGAILVMSRTPFQETYHAPAILKNRGVSMRWYLGRYKRPLQRTIYMPPGFPRKRT